MSLFSIKKKKPIALHQLIVNLCQYSYRLCPEHPYPAPVQDSLRALLHFMNTAEQYDVDPNRIAIVGA